MVTFFFSDVEQGLDESGALHGHNIVLIVVVDFTLGVIVLDCE